jgi:hypothetical protein
MKSIFLRSRVVIAVSMALSVLPLSAKQPPPFGESITWSTGKDAPTLEGMRGKSVLVLIALNTDGGGLDEAFEYMRSRTDPDLWLVGVEESATYYRQATGDDAL